MRDEWVEQISWIWLVDRLSENELVNTGSSKFQ